MKMAYIRIKLCIIEKISKKSRKKIKKSRKRGCHFSTNGCIIRLEADGMLLAYTKMGLYPIRLYNLPKRIVDKNDQKVCWTPLRQTFAVKEEGAMGAYEIISRLETLRREIRTRNNVLIVSFLGIFLAGMFGGPILGFFAPFLFILLFVVVFVFGILGNNKSKEFKQLYKQYFVAAMLGEFFENPQYIWDKGFTSDAVRSFGISQLGNRFYSEDYISGIYKGVPFEQSDVKIQYHTSGKNSHTTTYFSGRMFVFHFTGRNVLPVQIFSEGFSYRAKPIERFKMHKVNMESVNFNKSFDVKAANEHDAFYVLTPQMMEKLFNLQSRFGNVALNFAGDTLFLGYNCGMGAFDADMRKPIDYPTEKAKMQRDMQVIMDIIDIMELANQNVQ